MPWNLSWTSFPFSNVLWVRIFRYLFPEVSLICHLPGSYSVVSFPTSFPWRNLWSWQPIHFFLAMLYPLKTIFSFHKIGAKTKPPSFLNFSVELPFCYRHNQLPWIKLLFSRVCKLKCPIWEMEVERYLTTSSYMDKPFVSSGIHSLKKVFIFQIKERPQRNWESQQSS